MSIIYAKCIRGSQYVTDKERFNELQNRYLSGEEQNPFYCIGAVTVPKVGFMIDAVPLNLIFDCLKHGMLIAVIEYNTTATHYFHGNVNADTVHMHSQRVLSVRKADSISTVDWVFDTVGNPDIIRDGYISFLSDDVQAHFRKRKAGYKS